MFVISWIKYMKKWLASNHKSFIKRKEGSNKRNFKEKKWFNLWSIHQCLQITHKLKWARFVFNTIKFYQGNVNFWPIWLFSIFYVIEICSKFDSKFFISHFQRFNILVNSIFNINHMSFNLLSLCITSKVWKLWNSFVHVII
jgi:hypothetical protein